MNPSAQMNPLEASRLLDWLAIAAEAGFHRAQRATRRRNSRSGHARRPGADSPLWNAFAAELRAALVPHGSQARLARYLGLPKQRLTDFLSGRRRLPDAEITLRLLHWYTAQRTGRDPSV